MSATANLADTITYRQAALAVGANVTCVSDLDIGR